MEIVIAIISLFFLWLIIGGATDTSKKVKLMKAQTRILMHIAEKIGVDNNKLESIKKDTKLK
jgi:hypothetical protein